MKAEFTNSAEVATLKIYDYVGKYEEVNTENIQNQLDECNGKPLEIYINSYGGEVFEGFAIYNMLRRYTGYKKVYIDGIAASIASVIAMAGNEVIMNKASMLMIHNASGCAFGTFKEMEQVAEALKKINEVIRDVYKEKTNLDDETLTTLMDNESYLTAQECVDYGFANNIIDDKEDDDETVTDTAKNNFINQIDQRIKTLNDLKTFKSLEKSDFFNAEGKKTNKPENKLKNFFKLKETE